MSEPELQGRAGRVVVKVGTSVLTGGTPRLNMQRMLSVVQQVAALHTDGREVILVSSGAVAAGREQLGFPEFSTAMPAKQMLSAVGQPRLMQKYTELFGLFEILIAQVLLTREDLGDRRRFLNARDTLMTLIDRRIVPIINENDAIATEEIRVGDNDNLSALVATLIEADLLILLTDQTGLFTADPRTDAAARLIPNIGRIDEATWALAGGSGSALGTGGMMTKLQAAQLAGRGGVTTVIASGQEQNALMRIVSGEAVGTRFEPADSRLETRKRWLLVEKPRGRLHIDSGAAQRLQAGGASLLPVGVTRVEGSFGRGMTVAVIGPDGREMAHGLISYDSDSARQLCGIQSAQIEVLLGYSYGDALVHRNNMVLI